MAKKPSLTQAAASAPKNIDFWGTHFRALIGKPMGIFMMTIGMFFLISPFLRLHLDTLPFFLFILTVPFACLGIYGQKYFLPLMMPKSSGLPVDHENRAPVHPENPKGTMQPEGIIYYGNDIATNKELYLSDGVARQHGMYLGTTGSGKTVGQSTISTSFLIAGSGYSTTDGKADLNLPVEHASRLWRMNRIDDFNVINYIRGDQDVWRADPHQEMDSHAFQPYNSSASSSLEELTKALLDGDGDIWAKRADSYIPAIIRPLAYKRDMQNFDMTLPALLDMLILENAGRVAGDESIPDIAKQQLLKFLNTLPGMNSKHLQTILRGQSLSGREGATILDQFGYIVMQIVPIFNMLAGDYGFIFNVSDAPRGHISMEDIVINRRVLLILLPALEVSTTSLASLGRITLAAQKSMMAKSLGGKLAGETKYITAGRPTASPVPFFSNNDEVGYYLVSGTAVQAAQARSIGFSLLYGAQDSSAMRRLSDEVSKEVDSIIGNTNYKLIGRVLDNNTVKELKEYFGEHFVARVDRLTRDPGTIAKGLYTEESVSMQKEDILSPTQLKQLIEGEFFFSYMDKLILARIPMFKVPELKTLYLPNYLSLSNEGSVKPISKDDYLKFATSIKTLLDNDGELPEHAQRDTPYKDLFEELKVATRANADSGLGVLNAGTCALLAMNIRSTVQIFSVDSNPFSSLANDPGINPLTDGDLMPSAAQDNAALQDDVNDFADIPSSATDEPHKLVHNVPISEESIQELRTADATASQTEDVFSDIFSHVNISEQDIRNQLNELTKTASQAGLPIDDSEKVDLIKPIKAHVAHPTPPTITKDKATVMDNLRTLIGALDD